MARSIDTLLTKQAGEYLVAAELCRLGMFATTFSGNMPHYDILAHSPEGRTVLVQVKAKSRSVGSWLLSTRAFLDFEELPGNHVIQGLRCSPVSGLAFVFADLLAYGEDVFYILTFEELQKIIHDRYANWLGIKSRPVINDSDLPPELLTLHRDAWQVITG